MTGKTLNSEMYFQKQKRQFFMKKKSGLNNVNGLRMSLSAAGYQRKNKLQVQIQGHIAISQRPFRQQNGSAYFATVNLFIITSVPDCIFTT